MKDTNNLYALRRAYLALLALNPSSPIRIHAQGTLAGLRDEIAKRTGMTDRAVQEHHEQETIIRYLEDPAR